MKRILLLLSLITVLFSTAYNMRTISRVRLLDVKFDMQVELQPEGQPGYVALNKVTLNRTPLMYDAPVLLVHNFAGGYLLMDTQIGDFVSVWAGGKELLYQVKTIRKFQVKMTSDFQAYTTFTDLSTGKAYTPDQLYREVYVRDVLTLQTCIEKYGDPAWGLLFIQAELVGEVEARREVDL